MFTRNAVALATLLFSLVLLPAASAIPQPAASAFANNTTSGAPLMFIENTGQFDPRARFEMRGASETMWLTEDAIWITVLGKQVDKEQVDKAEEVDCDASLVSLSTCLPASPRGVNLKLTFPGP